MCAGREFEVEGADTEKAPRGKVASNTGWSGKEICIGRTQGSGWKIVRNEFRQIERPQREYTVKRGWSNS